MAHIRKRKLPSGNIRWQCVWQAKGKWVSEMFETKGAATAKKIAIDGRRPSSSARFGALASDYIDYMETLVATGQRERSYLAMLQGHVNVHILPDKEFSDQRCCNIGTPECQQFLNRLILKVSAKLAVKVRTTLSQIFKHGSRTGFVGTNPVRDTEIKIKRRPEAGEDAPFVLPGKNVLRTLVEGAGSFDNSGRASAVIHILMYGGLRISELRGLPRPNCRLIAPDTALEITQRADRYNVIGSVKSEAGRRTVDIGPATAQALRVWLMAAPKAPAATDGQEQPQYAFPNGEGGVWAYPNFRARFWVGLMNHCGLVTAQPADKHIREFLKKNAEFKAPLFGPHMLRHVYASLQIEQGVTPKRLQKLIGHATLKMTLDTYGHLWSDVDADRDRARGVENIL